MTNALQKVAQRKDPSKVFKTCWEDYGFKGVKEDQTRTTVPIQRVIDVDNEEKTIQKLEQLETDKEVGKGLVRKTVGHLQGVTQKQMDSGQVEEYVPLVFDPEIVSILKQNAPLVDLIPEEGQEGYKAVYNIVGDRDKSIGFQTEGNVLDMSDLGPSNITFEKDEVDMRIWVDKVQISDFTQAAASHYMNVEDTTLGERVAEHAQVKEAQFLYGDPSQEATDGDDEPTGFIGSENGYKGLLAYAEDQDNVVDGTGFDEDRVKAIKETIHEMIQEENVNVNNLVVAVSWELYDKLENEADFDKLQTAANDRTVNVGLNQLQIAGVPVQPTHTIREYEDGDDGAGEPEYEVGTEGDVFIFSTRTARYRALMPMSMVPLAKRGLSEEMALAEFGAFIEKSQGHFVRVIENVPTA